MLKIWGRLNSVNVQKVVWAAAELDLPFQRIDAGGPYGGLDTSSYAAKNPNRRIPTIEDGDLIVWESHACLRYLAARYGAGTLWPEDAASRVPVDMWLDWYHTEGYVHMRDVFMQLVRTPAPARDNVLIEHQRAALEPKLGLLDTWLETRAYVAGDRFTIADIALGLLADRWFRLDIPRADFVALEAWYQRLTSRSAYQEYCAAPLT